ncbi:MAG: hypothetical protein AABW49_03615 [Nanoarchaeota archaeon]
MSDENIIRVAKHIIIDNPEAELGDPLAEHGYDPLVSKANWAHQYYKMLYKDISAILAI